MFFYPFLFSTRWSKPIQTRVYECFYARCFKIICQSTDFNMWTAIFLLSCLLRLLSRLRRLTSLLVLFHVSNSFLTLLWWKKRNYRLIHPSSDVIWRKFLAVYLLWLIISRWSDCILIHLLSDSHSHYDLIHQWSSNSTFASPMPFHMMFLSRRSSYFAAEIARHSSIFRAPHSDSFQLVYSPWTNRCCFPVNWCYTIPTRFFVDVSHFLSFVHMSPFVFDENFCQQSTRSCCWASALIYSFLVWLFLYCIISSSLFWLIVLPVRVHNRSMPPRSQRMLRTS